MILDLFQTELLKVPLFLRMIHRSHSSSVFQECNRNRSFDCLDSAWRYHYVFVLVQLKSVFIKIWEVIAVFTYCAVGKAWRSEYRRYVSEKKDVMEDTLFSYPWWDGRWCWKRTQMNAFCTTVPNQIDQICLTCLTPLKSNVFDWRRKQKWRKQWNLDQDEEPQTQNFSCHKLAEKQEGVVLTATSDYQSFLLVY